MPGAAANGWTDRRGPSRERLTTTAHGMHSRRRTCDITQTREHAERGEGALYRAPAIGFYLRFTRSDEFRKSTKTRRKRFLNRFFLNTCAKHIIYVRAHRGRGRYTSEPLYGEPAVGFSTQNVTNGRNTEEKSVLLFSTDAAVYNNTIFIYLTAWGRNINGRTRFIVRCVCVCSFLPAAIIRGGDFPTENVVVNVAREIYRTKKRRQRGRRKAGGR